MERRASALSPQSCGGVVCEYSAPDPALSPQYSIGRPHSSESGYRIGYARREADASVLGRYVARAEIRERGRSVFFQLREWGLRVGFFSKC